MIQRIYLDMDEVLVDFVGGMSQAWGLTKEIVVQHWEAGQWDMKPALTKALGWPEPMTGKQFWDRVNGSEEFWTTLQPTPWMWDLIHIVDDLTKDWHIVSAPSYCDSSYTGKVKWLKARLGLDFNRFCLTPHKEIFSTPNTVLIDDRDLNVHKFSSVPDGGKGIIFPQHHNCLHTKSKTPLAHVFEELQTLQQLLNVS